VHPRMAGNISILTSCVVVFGEIGVPPLTERLNDFAAIGFHKNGIPLFLGFMGALDCFQAQSSHYSTMTNFKTSV
jgi:hypothetical protein